MSRKPTTGGPVAEQQAELGILTPHSLLDLLARKAAPHLSTADLEGIVSGSATHVEDMAQRLAAMSEGLGCLVAHDGGGEVPGAGSFQSGDSVSQLLFLYGDVLQSIAGVASAAGWALSELKERARQ